MTTYYLRVPNYASDDFAEITVTASSEADARRIASEKAPSFAWDAADCHPVALPQGVSVESAWKADRD